MSDPLNITVNALNSTGLRLVKDASSIFNASSTGGATAITNGLVALQQDKTVYAAQAKFVHPVAQNDKTLVDILA